MKEPTLKETTLISILLHSLVLFMAFFVIKGSPRVTLPSPYIVTLVSPTEIKKTAPTVVQKKTEKSKIDSTTIKEIKQKRQKTLIKTKKELLQKTKQKVVPKKDTSYEETIAALKAKKRIEERVMKKRQVLSVRKKYLSKDSSEEKPMSNKPSDSSDNAGIISSYYSQIQERIWGEWVYPEFRLKEDLLAIINIKILKDGQVKILGIEKSSGNSLFDRSAIRAIRKASPLPPPPYEIEIGVRFTP